MATVDRAKAGHVLQGVSWESYREMRDDPDHDHLRMTYHDGTLIFVSPEYIHDRGAERLGLIVRAVVEAYRIRVAGTRTTTLRREGVGPLKGDAKEPDNAYYVGFSESLIRGKDTIDLEIDPPPDLAIEVDNKSDSTLALPIYAALLIPEVWRYQARGRTLWFGGLADGSYDTIDRSLCLPMLTPDLVLFALKQSEDEDEMTWNRWLRGWAATLPGAVG